MASTLYSLLDKVERLFPTGGRIDDHITANRDEICRIKSEIQKILRSHEEKTNKDGIDIFRIHIAKEAIKEIDIFIK